MRNTCRRFRSCWTSILYCILVLLVWTCTAVHARLERGLSENSFRPANAAGNAFQKPLLNSLSVRGGVTPSNPAPPMNYADYPNSNNQEQPSGYYEDGFANYDMPIGNEAEHLFRETVQDRVDKWRESQIAARDSRSPGEENQYGTTSLFSAASVSRGSRAFIFFVLMWRDVHLFETADQVLKGMARLLTVVPLTMMFIANMGGMVASFTSPSHSAKKRMKLILNLDKIVEGVLLVWYFIRLTVAPSKYVPRELFIANTLHSIFFLIQCQAFTRVNWDEIKTEVPSMQRQQPEMNYYGEPQRYRTDHPEPMYVNQPNPYESDRYGGYESNRQGSYQE